MDFDRKHLIVEHIQFLDYQNVMADMNIVLLDLQLDIEHLFHMNLVANMDFDTIQIHSVYQYHNHYQMCILIFCILLLVHLDIHLDINIKHDAQILDKLHY